VLATSREPLAIPGEIRWPVPALAVPPEGTTAGVEALVTADSVRLFTERACRANPRFTLTGADAAAVARLCRRLEGIPLAIELAAARMGGLSAGQLAEELDERLPLATAAARGVPGRHTTMWACIDWSYRLLTTPEQAAFRCLAGFIGPFTADAFAAVTRATLPAGSGPPAETLYRLVGKSLVSAEPDTGHYRVLETIRAFCAEQARDAGELTAARDAHAGYYASWLAGLDANDAGDDVIDLIDADYPNVRAALTWSIEAGSPRAAAIAARLGQVWQERGHYHDAIVLGDAALRTAAADDPPLWAKAVASLANARLLGGDMEFLDALTRAEAIARAAGDRRTEGYCQLVIGTRPPFSAALLAAAHEAGAAGPYPVLAALGAIFLAYGGTEPHGERWLSRAKELSDPLGNATLSAAQQIAWADCLVEQGRLAEAVELAAPAAFDHRIMPTVRLLGIGRTLQVAFHRRDPALADLAATMSQELSHVWPTGGPRLLSSWTVFGNLLQMWSGLLRGERPPAPDLRTLGRATRMGLTPSAVRTICRAAIDRGDRLDPAAVAMATGPPAPGSLMAASLAAVQAAHATLDGNHALAERRWTEALSAAAPEGYLLLVCDALEGLGCLAAGRGETARAGQLLAAASQCRDDTGYRHRFAFEQDLLDQASLAAAPPPGSSPPAAPPPWREAVATALHS
jgi:predicted ATPase